VRARILARVSPFSCRFASLLQYTILPAHVHLPLNAWLEQESRKHGVSAQVGEWLKPADCKSAPPRRYEGSNPSLCTRELEAGASASGSPARDSVNRLLLALAAFVALGILSWTTLRDPRIRAATLAVLAMFALKTWLRRKDVLHPDRESETEQ
jgi:hypothetical protein